MKLLVVFPVIAFGLIVLQMARPPEGPKQMRGHGARFVSTEHAAARESPLEHVLADVRSWVASVATGRTPSDLDDFTAQQTREMKGPTVNVPDTAAMIARHEAQANARRETEDKGCDCQ